MLIRRMTAVFGRLQGQTLELREGLNILQAPNESGKSTWCSFLLSMFYGINSRERDRAGFIADKNRYAPWTGTAMSGRLDCETPLGELTLTRSTRRPAAPMGHFQAVYAGTGDAVPGLTGQTCGETLLGVSREVFERSAFIRQAGLAITQDVGLERRIASLISSGEEDVSYSEAADMLKKQLNRRRHNKTGQLPLLEAELRETERQISEAEALGQELSDACAKAEALEARQAALTGELNARDRWEASEQRRALSKAQAEADRAGERADLFRRRMEEARIPENDVIGRLRGAIVNLQMARKSLDKANVQRDEAAKHLEAAQDAVHAHTFQGVTPEEAEQTPLELSAKPRFPLWLAGLLVLAGAGFAAVLWLAVRNPLIAVGCGCGLLGLGFLLAGRQVRKRQARWEADTERLRQRRRKELEEYAALYRTMEAARTEAAAKSAAAESLSASLLSSEQGILLEVRRFAPSVSDIPAADDALRACAVYRKELTETEAAAREAQMRYSLLAQRAPAADAGEESVAPPARSREEIAAELGQIRADLSAARSAADRLTGRLHVMGDTAVLRSAAGHLTQEIQRLERECGAIRLAAEVLEKANTTLQTRFSPALGRHTAEIFSALTGGRYTGVVLDRSLQLSAEPAGDSVYRDAALLSAGAADQLYLAVRLAICDLVLPAENAVPVVLDDAFANFDDARAVAALVYLKEAAQNRQILLFTCHSREAEFFRNDPAVSIQHLTGPAAVV